MQTLELPKQKHYASSSFDRQLLICLPNSIFDKDGNIVPCTSRSFECRIKKYCKNSGMSELKSQHDARRTFATDFFYADMPLKNLQVLLGHSSLKQTQDYIYTKPCDNVDEYLDAINM